MNKEEIHIVEEQPVQMIMTNILLCNNHADIVSKAGVTKVSIDTL